MIGDSSQLSWPVYNNHWVLKTSPDDWWNVIVRNISQAVDENGDKKKVRNFFVSHEGKKQISVVVPELGLKNEEYGWLFDQFSEGIKKNIKVPGYVDIMKADFSTTTSDQLISSEIMLMSSLQKYFEYVVRTRCGVPGVEMKGTLEDWNHLLTKTQNMKKMLTPIMEDINLE